MCSDVSTLLVSFIVVEFVAFRFAAWTGGKELILFVYCGSWSGIRSHSTGLGKAGQSLCRLRPLLLLLVLLILQQKLVTVVFNFLTLLRTNDQAWILVQYGWKLRNVHLVELVSDFWRRKLALRSCLDRLLCCRLLGNTVWTHRHSRLKLTLLFLLVVKLLLLSSLLIGLLPFVFLVIALLTRFNIVFQLTEFVDGKSVKLEFKHATSVIFQTEVPDNLNNAALLSLL